MSIANGKYIWWNAMNGVHPGQVVSYGPISDTYNILYVVLGTEMVDAWIVSAHAVLGEISEEDLVILRLQGRLPC